MFWIFPVGISRVSPAVRSLISIAFVVLLVVVFYKPIAIAYHKRGASARRSAPASPAPVIQKSPANKTKQAQPAQGRLQQKRQHQCGWQYKPEPEREQ